MNTENGKQRFFDDAATEFAGEELSEEQEKIDWMLQAWDIKPGMTVLEPGCGAGQLTVKLAEAVGKEGQIIALDISQKMLEEARKRLANSEMENRVSLHHSSLEEFEITPDSVDIVVAYRVFPHLDDISAGLQVISRALKPDGRLFINHPGRREKINQFHQDIGGAVAYDTIPEEGELNKLLETSGLKLKKLIDKEGLYHALALKHF